METITEKEFKAIPNEWKCKYTDYDHQHPEWIGKTCCFLPNHGTTLFIEDVSFRIVKDGE